MPEQTRLTGWEHRTLQVALSSGFNADELEMLTMYHLDVDLASVVNTAAPLDKVIFDLVGWASRQGRLLPLFQGAVAQNARNPYIRRALAEVLYVDGRFEQLQSIVTTAGGGGDYQDPAPWREGFALAELAVCRIENPTGKPWGTGWLVANDAIITARHVWSEALAHGSNEEAVRAAFNYRTMPDGTEAFAARIALSASNRIVAESPIDDLDFILLRLAQPRGGVSIANDPAARRIAPLVPKPHNFAGGEPAIILQHPNGVPLKMAWGLVSPLASQTLKDRVTYQVNTEHGSSGGPVFLTDWKPVALHRQGVSGSSNGGVPMSLILPKIKPFLP